MKVDEQDNWAAAVGRPLEQASTLPPHAYTSADFFAAEVEWCFDGSWLFVGTADRAARIYATPLSLQDIHEMAASQSMRSSIIGTVFPFQRFIPIKKQRP